jgi:transcriptional regulator with XRE-family HTH domain
MENIGKKLQIVRDLYKYTQEQVASKIGFTSSEYAQLEQEDEIQMPILEKIAQEVYQLDPQKIISLFTDPRTLIDNIYENQFDGKNSQNGQNVNIGTTNITYNQENTKDSNKEAFEKDLEKIKAQLEFLLAIFDNKDKK